MVGYDVSSRTKTVGDLLDERLLVLTSVAATVSILGNVW